MPYSKRARSISNGYKKSAKRSRTGRYGTSQRKMSVYQRGNQWPYQRIGTSQVFDPFPAKITARLRYSQTVSMNPVMGLTARNLFRANSIFDPDATGGGHQPYGHDTYETIYNHYNVRSATITVTPTQSTDGIFGITLADDGTVEGDYNTVREQKNTVVGVITEGGTPTTLTQYFNVNRSFDVPFQKSTSAQFGATPSEQMFFHVWVEGPTSTFEQGSINLLVNITYLVDMWELKELGQS